MGRDGYGSAAGALATHATAKAAREGRLMGFTGAVCASAEQVALVNAGVTPHVPSRGSVGASGDLAPLAHLALVLIGEGRVLDGEPVESGRSYQIDQAVQLQVGASWKMSLTPHAELEKLRKVA